MHELPLTTNLIQMVVTECRKRNIARPKKIVVDLGMFTSYSKDSLVFYFDLLKQQELILKESTLYIHEVPGKIVCKQCRKKSIIHDVCMLVCPKCYSTDVTIEQGKEVILREIES
ncbi:MAG: hydrogenase maturation nickel metallochaperone HypA [Candidatus Thermoplasmatota archaeon]